MYQISSASPKFYSKDYKNIYFGFFFSGQSVFISLLHCNCVRRYELRRIMDAVDDSQVPPTRRTLGRGFLNR